MDSNVQERSPYTTEPQRRAAPHKIKSFCVSGIVTLRLAKKICTDPPRAAHLINKIKEKISSMVPRGWGGEGSGMNSGEYSLI